MFKTAFETLACHAYSTREIHNKIELAYVENELIELQTPKGEKVHHVLGIDPDNQDVPVFSHPYFITLNDVHHTIIDTRPYLRRTREGQIAFTNAGDYKFQLYRGILNHHWITESSIDLLNVGDLVPMVFCRWLSDSISRKIGLSPGEQVKVTTLTLFYWYSLFEDAEVMGEYIPERDIGLILKKLNQITSIPTTLALEVADDITYMGSLKHYVTGLQRVIGGPRAELITPAFIYALLGGSWFGVNVKETIAVATEHPPTFVAIITMAMESRNYRKTQIGSLVYDNDKRGRGDILIRNISSIMEGYYES